MPGALGLKAGTAIAGRLPTSVAAKLGSAGGRLASFVIGAKAAHLRENLATASELEGRELDVLVRSGFASYGRYWAETLKMPSLSATELDRGFSFVGYHHIAAGLAEGRGVLIALPHLGGWEWAAAWLGRVMNSGVTAVVEPLEPPEVFEWFAELRESYDVEVVPLGAGAASAVSNALARNRIVTLLCDRDIAGNGVEAQLFRHATKVPAGPAMVALRSDLPILPTAVYFREHDRICHVGEPLWPKRRGRLRDDVRAVTQELTNRIEELIAQAPEQWHVLEQMWPAPR